MPMKLSEAEIQVLATVEKTELDAQSTDQSSLEKQGERYWIFLEDWSDAFSSLIEKGLIDGDENAYRLTDQRLLAADKGVGGRLA